MAQTATNTALVNQRGMVNRLPPSDMWMLLLIRMVTRGPSQPSFGKSEEFIDDSSTSTVDLKGKGKAGTNDEMKHTLCDYIVADFASRYRYFMISFHSFNSLISLTSE